MKSFDERLIIRYLLGELSEEEQSRFEEQYFSDDHSIDLLEAARNDLIDAYLAGQLTPAEHERFERHFLASPHHAKKLEFTKSLRKLLTNTPQSAVSTSIRSERSLGRRRWSALFAGNVRIVAATAALLVISGGYLIFRATWHSQHDEIQTDAAATEMTATSSVAAQPTDEQNSRANQNTSGEDKRTALSNTAPSQQQFLKDSRSHTTTFLLTSVARGSGDFKPLIIPRNSNSVRLLFDSPVNADRHYEATIETVEGEEIWRSELGKLENARTRKKISLSVPAAYFESQDYILRLRGADSAGESETVSQYYLRVIKK